MSPKQTKEFESLLAEYYEAQRIAEISKAKAAHAHIALVEWVSMRVPAGTTPAETLDIPAFLRRTDD